MRSWNIPTVSNVQSLLLHRITVVLPGHHMGFTLSTTAQQETKRNAHHNGSKGSNGSKGVQRVQGVLAFACTGHLSTSLGGRLWQRWGCSLAKSSHSSKRVCCFGFQAGHPTCRTWSKNETAKLLSIRTYHLPDQRCFLTQFSFQLIFSVPHRFEANLESGPDLRAPSTSPHALGGRHHHGLTKSCSPVSGYQVSIHTAQSSLHSI